jgi:hypothetical protein
MNRAEDLFHRTQTFSNIFAIIATDLLNRCLAEQIGAVPPNSTTTNYAFKSRSRQHWSIENCCHWVLATAYCDSLLFLASSRYGHEAEKTFVTVFARQQATIPYKTLQLSTFCKDTDILHLGACRDYFG